MTYTKPEINHLGDAAQLIENITGKPVPSVFDPTQPELFNGDPAYDMDE